MRELVENTIDEYFKLEDKIWSYVGEKSAPYNGFEDWREFYWKQDGNEVWLFCEIADKTNPIGIQEEPLYQFEIYGTAIFRGPIITIAHCYSGSGDRISLILNNEKQL